MREKHYFGKEGLVLLNIIIDLHDLVDNTHNDQELGRAVRKIFKEFNEYREQMSGM